MIFIFAHGDRVKYAKNIGRMLMTICVKGSGRIEDKVVVLFTNISVDTIFLFNLRKTTLTDGVSII